VTEDEMRLKTRCQCKKTDAIEDKMQLKTIWNCKKMIDAIEEEKIKLKRCSCINKQRCALMIKDAFEVKHERIKR